MVLNCYESREIIGMAMRQPLASDLFYDLMFPAANLRFTTADKVAITRHTKSRVCAAPYTDPCGPGVSLKRPDTAAEIGEFKPPYIHLHDVVTPCDAEEYRVDPMTGEFVQDYTDRFERAIAEQAVKHRESVQMRMNITAAQILQNGAYVVEGENSPRMVVDFRRDERLTMDLVADGGDVWNQSSARPFKLLEAVTQVMAEYGVGSGGYDVIMSPAAWDWLSKHIDAERIVFGGNPRDAMQISTDVQEFQSIQYKGPYGVFRFWLVLQKGCIDGEEVDLLPNGSIGILNRAAFNGRRVFAGIRRADGTVEDQIVWFRDYYNEKCETRELHTRTRPMLIPANVNGSAWIKVVDPAAPATPICYDCASQAPAP